jgi:hypothetical protein
MKPSKFITVRGRKAWFLPPNTKALTWKGYVYCHSREDADEINKSDKIDSQLESHETIHVRQAESTHDSWFLFYLRYVWEWICNLPLIFVKFHAAYKFMPFEIEAYLNQDNWGYCMNGAAHQWKEFEKLTLKRKRELAKEYYGAPIRPYFTQFLYDKLIAKK